MKYTAKLATKILRFALALAAFLIMPVYGISGLRGSLPAGCVVAVLILIYALVGTGLLLARFGRALGNRFLAGLCWKKALSLALAANLMIAASAMLLAWKPGVVAVTVLVLAAMLFMTGAAWAIGRSLQTLWDLSGSDARAPFTTARASNHIPARNLDRELTPSRAGARSRLARFRRQRRGIA